MWAILKGWIAPEFYGLQIANQGSPPLPAGPAAPKKTKQGATQIDSLTTGAEVVQKTMLLELALLLLM